MIEITLRRIGESPDVWEYSIKEEDTASTPETLEDAGATVAHRNSFAAMVASLLSRQRPLAIAKIRAEKARKLSEHTAESDQLDLRITRLGGTP